MPEQIPYDEMRRILGLPKPPFDDGGVQRSALPVSVESPIEVGAEIGAPRTQGAFEVHPGGRTPRWASDLVVRAADRAGLEPLARWQIDTAAASLLSTVHACAPIGAAKDVDAVITRMQAFVAAMNEFTRAAAAATAVPTTFYPPKPKRQAGPRLPRPSHTPPPWAQDPARTRRTKNGGIDMRTPRV